MPNVLKRRRGQSVVAGACVAKTSETSRGRRRNIASGSRRFQARAQGVAFPLVEDDDVVAARPSARPASVARFRSMASVVVGFLTSARPQSDGGCPPWRGVAAVLAPSTRHHRHAIEQASRRWHGLRARRRHGRASSPTAQLSQPASLPLALRHSSWERAAATACDNEINAWAPMPALSACGARGGPAKPSVSVT